MQTPLNEDCHQGPRSTISYPGECKKLNQDNESEKKELTNLLSRKLSVLEQNKYVNDIYLNRPLTKWQPLKSQAQNQMSDSDGVIGPHKVFLGFHSDANSRHNRHTTQMR